MRRGRRTYPGPTTTPVPPRITRFSSLAAVAGGVLFVAQGVLMIMLDYNLDALPLALLLFSVGLMGIRARLRGSAGLVGTAGGLLALVALAASVTEYVALLLMRWREEIFWPIHSLALAVGLLAAILASLLLGIAAFRSGTLPPGWDAVVLAMCVLWLPSWLLGEWAGDRISPSRELSLGFVPAGLGWMLLGYASGFARRGQPTADPTTPATTSRELS